MKEKCYIAIIHDTFFETVRFLLEIKEGYIINDSYITVEVKKVCKCSDSKYLKTMRRGELINLKLPLSLVSADEKDIESYADSKIKKFEDISQALLWWELKDT